MKIYKLIMGVICCKPSDNLEISEAYRFKKRDFLGIRTTNITKDYFFEKRLGLGAYGEVKLGRNKKTDKLVAIKKI